MVVAGRRTSPPPPETKVDQLQGSIDAHALLVAQVHAFLPLPDEQPGAAGGDAEQVAGPVMAPARQQRLQRTSFRVQKRQVTGSATHPRTWLSAAGEG